MIFTAHADGWLDLPGRRVRCALGPAGVVDGRAKREGDGASPSGVFPLRRVLYRPDRGAAPVTALPAAPLKPSDGWCDDSADPAYNRPVTLPYPASAEALWREDRLYDLIVVVGYNDDPPEGEWGSAIFLHIAREDWSGTQGCIAFERAALLELVALITPRTRLRGALRTSSLKDSTAMRQAPPTEPRCLFTRRWIVTERCCWPLP